MSEANPQGAFQSTEEAANAFLQAMSEPEAPTDETQETAPEAEEAEPTDEVETLKSEEEEADEVDDSEDEEQVVEEEDEEPSRYTVKIDGEERQVTLDELTANYQKGEDYQRKTTALAEERKALESNAQQIAQIQQGYLEKLNLLEQTLEQPVVTREELNQLLEEGDTIEYNRLKALEEDRVEWKNKISQEKQQITYRQQQESQRRWQEKSIEEEKILKQVAPELANSESLRKVGKYLVDLGFAPEQVINAAGTDHKIILLAEKARKFDELKASKKGNKVQTVPKVMKKTKRVSKEVIQREQRSKDINRLRKTGSVDDAARVFFDMI